MSRFLLVCLGGAVGTGARYLLSLWVTRTAGPGFPFGTLIVNVIGSFLLVILMESALSTQTVAADMRLILGTGLLGGFTTYSAFNYETLTLLGDYAWGAAAAYVTATLAGCLLASLLAVVVVRAVAY